MPQFLIQESTTPPERIVAWDVEHATRVLRGRGLRSFTLEPVGDPDALDVIERGDDLLEMVREARRRGIRTGLTPTMGALHAGHISLVEASRRECGMTIATIFVNPTQFGPNEDFDRYPRTLDDDLAQLREAGASACFVPSVEEMYPSGSTTMVAPPAVAERWEGECRPGHFEGVATIVLKLFHLAPVDVAFFGSKDYQQARVIQEMARDLCIGIEIRSCPIIRELDGLALSSRNRYLSEAERTVALGVPRCLQEAVDVAAKGERDPVVLSQRMHATLHEAGIERIDYAEVVDAIHLHPLSTLDRDAVAIVAAYVGQTRLIDNRQLSPTA